MPDLPSQYGWAALANAGFAQHTAARFHDEFATQ
jgi:hypothetical protein